MNNILNKTILKEKIEEKKDKALSSQVIKILSGNAYLLDKYPKRKNSLKKIQGFCCLIIGVSRGILKQG